MASIQQVLAHDTGGLGWLNNLSGLILSVPTTAEYILKMMNEELLAGIQCLISSKWRLIGQSYRLYQLFCNCLMLSQP
jgi:hypothetical protein